MIRTEHVTQVVNSTGTAGSQTGSQTTRALNGLLLTIGVEQGNTPHANTDITISVGDGTNSRTLLTLTDYNTTTLTWYDVRAAFYDTAGAAVSGQYTAVPMNGQVTVSVVQGGSASTCDVTLVYTDE